MAAPAILIRPAEINDMPEVFQLIKELAIYEKAESEMEIDTRQLTRDGFGEKPLFISLVAESESRIVGVAIFFDYYSTWKGKCLYLQDLVVKEASRRQGIGELLMKAVATYALEKGYHSVLWQVLDWNTPAKEFYQKINAGISSEWENCSWRRKDMERFVG